MGLAKCGGDEKLKKPSNTPYDTITTMAAAQASSSNKAVQTAVSDINNTLEDDTD
jgi:hypothetical protein